MADEGFNFPPKGIFFGPRAIILVERGFVGGFAADPGGLGGRVPKGQPGGGRFVKGDARNVNYYFEERLRNRWADLAAEQRSQRPRTGKLEAAIRSSKNGAITGGAIAANFGFGVGNQAWLDSQAAYWRIIEQGTRRAAPAWVGPMVDAEGIPLYGRWSPGPRAFTRFAPLTGPGKLKVFGQGLRSKMEGGIRSSRSIPYRRTHIKASNLYQRAWDEVMGRGSVNYFNQLITELQAQFGITQAQARAQVAQTRAKYGG